MGEILSVIDVEIEQMDNKLQFLEHKIGIADLKLLKR